MKNSRLSSLAFAAALMLPAAASAQEVLHFAGVKSSNGDRVAGAATGAYMASRAPFISTFDIFCIDYDHAARSVWTAHEVTFAEAIGTYQTQAQRQLGTEKAWGIQQLRAAAYLTTQFAANPAVAGANNDEWDTIHGAIWSMFSANTNVNQSTMTAMAAAAVAAHGNETQWDDFTLLLDDQAFAANYSNATSLNQAFITYDPGAGIRVVPEPSTYALMGAGLLAVGVVRRKRRSV